METWNEQQPAQQHPNVSSAPFRALIVDDDEDFFRIFELTMLSTHELDHIQLDWCETYEAGLKALKYNAYDLAFLDYNIGEKTGLDLLTELQRTLLTPLPPVIMLTMCKERALEQEALHKGVSDFLLKSDLSKGTLERSVRHSMIRHHVVQNLSQSQERYALATEGSNDGLWDWNLVTDDAYFSDRWMKMIGCEGESFTHISEWFSRVHPEDQVRLVEEIEAHISGNTSAFELEYRVQVEDNSYRWMLGRGKAVRDAAGQAYRMVGWQSDTSSRVTSYDSLTHLPNANIFQERVQRALSRQKSDSEYVFAVLSVHFDNLKTLQTSFGSNNEGVLLKQVARRLERRLRHLDVFVQRMYPKKSGASTLAQVDGDEFAVLLHDVRTEECALKIAKRLQKQLEYPFELDGQLVHCRVSIGIRVCYDFAEQPINLLRDADTAMRKAKTLGKQSGHSIALVSYPGMYEEVQTKIYMEQALYQAISNEEFVLYYQPIVCLQTQQLHGVEALIRWQHPTMGFCSPDEFIPLAEDIGLSVPLGEWVMSQACRQLNEWHRTIDPNLTMSINLSAQQLAAPRLLPKVQSILEETRVDPNKLHFEVTESSLIKNEAIVIEVLQTLRDMGIRIHIDDFGTGYSSLSRLSQLPLDALKIDKSFTQSLGNKEEDKSVAHLILHLAEKLNLYTIAEGIETEDQEDFYQVTSCQFGQGYLYSRPLDAQSLTSWIHQHIPRRYRNTPLSNKLLPSLA